MDRRAFARLCLLGAAAFRPEGSAWAQPRPSASLIRYNRALLTTSTGEPLRSGGLDREEEYLFFYPFVSTPCLLLDLGQPLLPVHVPMKGQGVGYDWGGGVGPKRSIVAFTAICPHEWSHPDRSLSPIHYYRAGERAKMVADRDRLIVCCVHASAFDPAAGGRLEQGPAELPLAVITMEWDRTTDQLFASGVLGANSFERFFRGFKGKSRALVGAHTPVMRLQEYSAVVVRC